MIVVQFKKAALVAVFLCLFGCAAAPVDKSYPPVPEFKAPTPKNVAINLTLLPSAAAVKKQCNIQHAVACAIPGPPCFVYVNAEDFIHYLWHELAHCIYGYWHTKQGKINGKISNNAALVRKRG